MASKQFCTLEHSRPRNGVMMGGRVVSPVVAWSSNVFDIYLLGIGRKERGTTGRMNELDSSKKGDKTFKFYRFWTHSNVPGLYDNLSPFI